MSPDSPSPHPGPPEAGGQEGWGRARLPLGLGICDPSGLPAWHTQDTCSMEGGELGGESGLGVGAERELVMGTRSCPGVYVCGAERAVSAGVSRMEVSPGQRWARLGERERAWQRLL